MGNDQNRFGQGSPQRAINPGGLTPRSSKIPSSLKHLRILIWLVLLTMLAAVGSHYRIFSGFNPYDDEGTLIITVKQYLDGHKLYDYVATGYGPVYYLYNWLVHSLYSTPVTHDFVRAGSLFPWLTSALICAWLVLRFTGSIVLATAAHLVTVAVMTFFEDEPGHPQELCMLLMI